MAVNVAAATAAGLHGGVTGGDGASVAATAAVWRALEAAPRDAAAAGVGGAAPLPPPLLALLVGALDLVAIAFATALAHAALGGIELPPTRAQLGAVGLAAMLTFGFAAPRGAYRPAALFSYCRQVRALLPAAGLAAATTLLAAAGFGALSGIDARWSALALALGGLLLSLGRSGVATLLRGVPAARAAVAPRVVVLGGGPGAPAAARLSEFLRRHDVQALRLLGVVDDQLASEAPPGGGARVAGLPLLGPVETLFAMLRRGEVDQVVIALPRTAEAGVQRLLRRLAEHPVDIRLAPDPLAYGRRTRGRTELGRGAELLHLADRPISGWRGLVKVAEDYTLALGALAIAAVPMALIALAIRLDSPGPALFRQRRTGFNGCDFHVFKFRTMYHESADPEVLRQVCEGDPRVTRVGTLLRRTSLDELPQIFNVLRGEMSVVGPRPHAPGTRAGGRRFEEVDARYAARHRVKPGLTGLAQVRGWRGPTETEEKLIRRVESDLEYIENWSLWLDFTIILRTLVAVARMRNAH